MLDILAIVVSLLAMGLSTWNNFRGFPRTPTPKDYFYICDVKNCGFKINGPTANGVQLVGKVHYWEHHAANDNKEGEPLAEWEKDLVVEHEHEWEFITSEHVRYRRCFSCELEEPDVVEHKHSDFVFYSSFNIAADVETIHVKCGHCRLSVWFASINMDNMIRDGSHVWDDATNPIFGEFEVCRNCGIPKPIWEGPDIRMGNK